MPPDARLARLPAHWNHLLQTACSARHQGGFIMLKWAIIFAVIALIAGALGFGGIAGASAGIAKLLFIVFLVIAAVMVLAAVLGGKAVSRAIK